MALVKLRLRLGKGWTYHSVEGLDGARGTGKLSIFVLKRKRG